jgi:hypothetical protein
LHVDYDGAADRVDGEFANDFGFGLEPVFAIVAHKPSTALKEFSGTAADGLLHLLGIFPEDLPHAGGLKSEDCIFIVVVCVLIAA